MSSLYDNLRSKGVSVYMKESRLFRIIYHLMENGKSTGIGRKIRSISKNYL